MLTRQGTSRVGDSLGKGGEFRDRGVRDITEVIQPEDENCRGGEATIAFFHPALLDEGLNVSVRATETSKWRLWRRSFSPIMREIFQSHQPAPESSGLAPEAEFSVTKCISTVSQMVT